MGSLTYLKESLIHESKLPHTVFLGCSFQQMKWVQKLNKVTKKVATGLK